jgi:polygalacturonase
MHRIMTSVATIVAVAGAAFAAAAPPAKTYDVREMGAAGDGMALDGPIVQRAIDAAAAAGGGTVLLPSGTYLSGAVRMKSHVTLRLEKDAVLLAADDAALFPPVASRWEGGAASYPSPLVVMEECRDAAIVGAGTLSGGERCTLVKKCKDIRFDGITFTCKLRWTLHLLYSDGVVVENCRFTTDGQNTDGIDPDSSRNIVIRRCFFDTGDDCIAIKSGVNAEGVRVGRPSENITIEDCVMVRGHGAVSLGSEMSGGVRNVTIRRCKMSGCGAAVRIKTRRGRGGYVADVHVSDCVANDNRAALLIDTQYKWTPGLDAIPGPEGIPVLKNFSFENVTGAGNKKAIAMVGMPERPVEGIVLKNVTLTGGPPGHIENARDVVIESVKLDGPLTIVNVTGTGLRSGQLARQGTEFSEPPLTSWDETVRRVRRHGLERQWFPRPACHACHGAGRRTVACPRHLR